MKEQRIWTNEKRLLVRTVILVLVAAAWAFGLFGGTDPAIAKLQEIGDQMNDQNLPDAQRDQLRDQLPAANASR